MLTLAHRPRCETLRKAIAVAILLRLASLIDIFDNVGVTDILGGLVLVTLVSALAATVGIWRGSAWGFLCFYVFGVLITVLFGVSLVPFVVPLLPPDIRVAGLFAWNACVLGLVAVLQWRCRGSAAKLSSGRRRLD